MLEKATVLTTLFTIVDDVMKGSAMIQDALKRPGPAPKLTDSELVTIAIYQELIGEPREDHFFRLHQASLLTFFPGLNERSRYNRRKRDLWSVILAVRITSRPCLAMEPSMMRPYRAFLSSIAVCSCLPQPRSTNPRNDLNKLKDSSIVCA